MAMVTLTFRDTGDGVVDLRMEGEPALPTGAAARGEDVFTAAQTLAITAFMAATEAAE